MRVIFKYKSKNNMTATTPLMEGDFKCPDTTFRLYSFISITKAYAMPLLGGSYSMSIF
eukprot:UN13282